MPLDESEIRRYLEELAETIEFSELPAVDWVVCGGAALSLQGLQPRTTHDVDVLGAWNESRGGIEVLDRISKELRACIEQVGRAHTELASNARTWVNLGPRQLAVWGLPEGFEARLVPLEVSPWLRIQLLGRRDLVALKLYAAANPQGQRQAVHRADLATLNPSVEELEAGLKWVLDLPDEQHELIRSELKGIIEELGHDDIAYYL